MTHASVGGTIFNRVICMLYEEVEGCTSNEKDMRAFSEKAAKKIDDSGSVFISADTYVQLQPGLAPVSFYCMRRYSCRPVNVTADLRGSAFKQCGWQYAGILQLEVEDLGVAPSHLRPLECDRGEGGEARERRLMEWSVHYAKSAAFRVFFPLPSRPSHRVALRLTSFI